MSRVARIEVERLEELGRSRSHVILRASGRAWSAVIRPLAAPVLVADGARIPAAAVSAAMSADSSGPAWSAEFRVPLGVAASARDWAVEVVPGPPARARPAEPSPQPEAPREEVLRLARVPGLLHELSEELRRLERRSAEVAARLSRAEASQAGRSTVVELEQALVALRAALARAERARDLAEAARAAAEREAEALRRELASSRPDPDPSRRDAPPRFSPVSPVAAPFSAGRAVRRSGS